MLSLEPLRLKIYTEWLIIIRRKNDVKLNLHLRLELVGARYRKHKVFIFTNNIKTKHSLWL